MDAVDALVGIVVAAIIGLVGIYVLASVPPLKGR